MFPKAGFQFLRQLKLHNDRDWFRERKEEYRELVEDPMKQIVVEVATQCRKHGIPLHAKDRSPVMRVYRDIRFSKDKLPFKTHVAAELRRSFKDSQAMLYLHLSPEESFVAAGVWQPERTLLQSWREMIVQHPEQFAAMQKALKRGKLALSEQSSLSKLPRGFQQYGDDEFAAALKLTSFVVSRPIARLEATSKDFVKAVVKFAVAAKPLMEFSWRVEQAHAQSNRSRLREAELA